MARFWPVGLVMVVLAGCSAEPAVPVPTPLPAASSALAGTSPTPPEPSGTDSRPRFQMPLALIVQTTRAVADVPVASARGLVAEGGTRWAAIGQPGGRMRVLTTQTGGPGSVLRAVRESQDVLGIIPAEAVDPTVRVLTVGGRHPLRDPQTYPLEIAWSSRLPQVTTLAAVGDVMLGRRVARRHADDPGAPLRPLSDRLAAADVTVGNFEATLSTDGSPTQGGDSFAASRRVLPGLRAAGFDVLSLANNHVGDYGERALRQTLTGSPTARSRRSAPAPMPSGRADPSSSNAAACGSASLPLTPSVSPRRPRRRGRARTGWTCRPERVRWMAAISAGSPPISAR